jgi:hypothetical protein
MKIAQRTADRLVVESRPRAAFGIAIGLGVIALAAASYPLLQPGAKATTNELFGLALGLLIAVGGPLLYRETITVFDRRAGTLRWTQRGLLADLAASAPLDHVRDVVVGRPVSEQSGGASTLVLVLHDRRLPLMFGFSATARHAAVRAAIVDFLALDRR